MKITITYKNRVEVYIGAENEVYEIVKEIRNKKEYVSYIIEVEK